MDLFREIGQNLSKQRALLAAAKKDLQRIQTIQKSLQESLTNIWTSTELPALEKSRPQWKGFVDLVASGRMLSVAAQANDALKAASSGPREESWIGNGTNYASWLGGGIAALVKRRDAKVSADEWQPVADLCGKSFFLGYTDEIVAAIITSTVLERPRYVAELKELIRSLRSHEQRRFLLSTVELVSKRYLPTCPQHSDANPAAPSSLVGAGAALIDAVVSADSSDLAEHLSGWLLAVPNASISMYRAVIAAMFHGEREKVLEQIWTKFSDKMVIKHINVVQQEHLAQALLLLAGAVRRRTPMAVFMLGHSSIHTAGVSARLSSSSPKVRFLGMAVGCIISQLIDKPETRMKFDFEGEDKKAYEELANLLAVDDHVGSLDDSPEQDSQAVMNEKALTLRPKQQKPRKAKASKAISKIQVIEEDDDSDDDLAPYAKADTDPEDSDDDPTLVQRKKPKAPVYIRDLITQLSNTEDADIQHLALKTAPSLIRRKADFGTELSDRAIEICAAYFHLSDPFALDNFLELRLQGMIALLVAQPKSCGPYFATTVFEGDFNIGQRVAGLTALGLAARELAGYKTDNDHSSENQFPSKTLPERLHKLYLQDSEMDRLSNQLSKSMLNPVSTTKKRSQRKVIRNDLTKIVAECFFFPLTANFASHASGLPSGSHVLPTLVKTLAIILTSAGPSTLMLPQLTAEMLSLLLTLRTRAVNDHATLEALLFGFLSVLNVNEDKRSLVERHSRDIVEIHEWCNTVFDRLISGLQGVHEEEERIKTLCAGVLVATKEVIESYERLMVIDPLTSSNSYSSFVMDPVVTPLVDEVIRSVGSSDRNFLDEIAKLSFTPPDVPRCNLDNCRPP